MSTQVGGRPPSTTDSGDAQRRVGRAPTASRVEWPTWVALVLAVVFVGVTVLVVTGVTQSIDSRVVQHVRPNDDWGEAQVVYSPWMGRLRPEHVFLMLAVTSLVLSLWRWSWWPLVFGGVLATATVVITLLIKFSIERPDPHDYVAPSGGSYPSGHMIAVLVCSAGCVLLVWPTMYWWMWVPVLAAGGLMAAALVAAAAHWPTDVVGGALLAVAVVSASSRSELRRRAHRPPRRARARG